MKRSNFGLILVAIFFMTGCGFDPLKGKDEKDDGKPIINRDTAVQAAGPAGGAAKRASLGVDLSQLRIYLQTEPYPQSLADLQELQRTDRRMYEFLQKGEIVIVWPNVKMQSGVWAYEKQLLTSSFPLPVLTSSGIQNMTASELKAQLK
jgi:hypothetical protein